MPPTPLADSSRRFLRPLLGIDPASVEIHRGGLAEQVVRAYGADALAVGNHVFVGGTHAADSPADVGLLAHELTHVARSRQPRFIPPLARAAPRPGHGGPRQSVEGQSENVEVDARTGPVEEEVLAEHVERQATRLARAAQTPAGFPPAGPSQVPARRISAASTSDPLSALPGSLVGPSAGAVSKPLPHGTPGAEQGPPAVRSWGGLPAPWEPLPEWFADPVPPAGGGQPAVQVSSSSSAELPALPLPTAGALPAVPARAAAAGRSSTDQANDERPAASEHRRAPVEPDIDALARQVYVILKRRLAAEQRRWG